jgi:hypothetical protein
MKKIVKKKLYAEKKVRVRVTNSPALVLKPGNAFKLSLTALASSISLLPKCSSPVAGTCCGIEYLGGQLAGEGVQYIKDASRNLQFPEWRSSPFFVVDFISQRVVLTRGFDWLRLPITIFLSFQGRQPIVASVPRPTTSLFFSKGYYLNTLSLTLRRYYLRCICLSKSM